MREGFEIISGGKTGRMFLFGAVIALAAALVVTFMTRNNPDIPLASADSLSAPLSAPAKAGYIKIGDIKGESTDKAHKDWIEIQSFSHSVSAPASIRTSGGGGAVKATVRDFVITKDVDKASPLLMQAALNGQHIPLVEFELERTGADGRSTPYLKYELKDVIITNYRTGGSSSGDVVPTESISLNFAEIKVTYTEQKADGSAGESVEAGWNVKENRAQ